MGRWPREARRNSSAAASRSARRGWPRDVHACRIGPAGGDANPSRPRPRPRPSPRSHALGSAARLLGDGWQVLVPLAVEVVDVEPEGLRVRDVEEGPLLGAAVAKPAVLEPVVEEERAARLEARRLGGHLGVEVEVRARDILGRAVCLLAESLRRFGGRFGRRTAAGRAVVVCRGEVDERHEHVDRVHGRDEARVAPRVHVRPIRMPPTSSSSRLRLLLLQRTQPSARTLPSSSSPHPHPPHQCGATPTATPTATHTAPARRGGRRSRVISGHLGSSRVISGHLGESRTAVWRSPGRRACSQSA